MDILRDKIVPEFQRRINAGLLCRHAFSDFIPEENTYLVSIGKAANEMAKAFLDIHWKKVTDGIIFCPDNSRDYHLSGINRYTATHPIPDSRSFENGDRLIDFIKKSGHSIVFLISGGGSSLVEKETENFKEQDIIQIHQQLLRSGANINEINQIRSLISGIKGGKLLDYCHHDCVEVFILSDIFSGEFENVSSGLTYRKEYDGNNINHLCERYLPDYKDLYSKISMNKMNHIPEVKTHIIADNRTAMEIMAESLKDNGFETILHPYRFKDEAGLTGLNIGCQAYKYTHEKGPYAVVYGGESTVTLREMGIGGRCLEIALAVAMELQFIPNVRFLCLATDGKDGNSPARGVVVDSETIRLLLGKGFNPNQMLKTHNTFQGLYEVGCIIDATNSESNLNDIGVLIFE